MSSGRIGASIVSFNPDVHLNDVPLNGAAGTLTFNLAVDQRDEVLLFCRWNSDGSTSVTAVTFTFRVTHPVAGDSVEFVPQVLAGSGTLTATDLLVSKAVSTTDLDFVFAVPVTGQRIEVQVGATGTPDANDKVSVYSAVVKR